MKSKRLFMALLAVLAGALILGGCDWNYEDPYCDNYTNNDKPAPGYQTPGYADSQAYYTVDFVVLGGPVTPNQQTVKPGAKATDPVVKDLFNNICTVIWYTDQMFTIPYSFYAPVFRNITLYGKWELGE